MDDKLLRKALRMQKVTYWISAFLRFKYRRDVYERVIETKHGPIRIVEFGFENADTTLLYIDLHGGGFVLQKADVNNYMNLYIQRKTKIKIVSIDYPNAPQNPYPVAQEAIYEVIKYYHDHAKELALDPDNFGIGGHSAGGTLTASTLIRANKDKDLSFKFQILAYPPTDLTVDPYTRPKQKRALPPWLMQLFNESYFGDLENAKKPDISPLLATKEMLENQPSALLILAGMDSLHDEGLRYGELLKAAGVYVEVHDFKKSVHGFIRNGNRQSVKAYDIMADFINRYFFGKSLD